MAKIDGAVILTRMLKEAGVEKIFTLSGGHIFRIHQECEKNGIQVMDTRHEGAAAYAAMAYAQASGKMGVVVATAGPGVTNIVTAVTDMKLYDTPVLVIGGGCATSQELTETLQEFDTTTMMSTCTKWAKRCYDTKRIGEFAAVAIRNACGVDPGPVYLEIPTDILSKREVEESEVKFPVNYLVNTRSHADPEVVEKVADMLIAAKRPAMLIGEGVQFQAQDMDAFRELAEYLQIPTSMNRTAKGWFFHEDKPLYRVGQLAAAKADVILTLNLKTDAFEMMTTSTEAKYISVHRTSQHIGLNRPVEYGILGHSDAVARQIVEAVKKKTAKRDKSDWVEEMEKARQENLAGMMEKAYSSDISPVHPGRLAYEVQKFLNNQGKGFCQVVDGGDCMMWETMTANLTMEDTGAHPGRITFGTKLGCIGYGYGAALGVWAATGKPVILTTGDGSFGQYVGELFTYAKHGAPIIVLISNDSNFGMIKGLANLKTPDGNNDIAQVIASAGGDMFFYDKIPQAWGGYGELVVDPDEVVSALGRAVESGKPAVINVAVSCEQSMFAPGTVGLYLQLMG